MAYFAPCWSCGSNAACFNACECAKCIDPVGYEDWRRECPEEYQEWLERQREIDEYDEF